MYLLDTNICILAIKSKPQNVIENIKVRLEDGIFISSLTVAELEFGVANSKQVENNRVALFKFLSFFNTIIFENKDAVVYGMVRHKLKVKGQIIGPIDMLLAAQAISKGLILITNNSKEFLRVDNLKTEDWTNPFWNNLL